VSKSERPVGVPAALAWGMEGLPSEARSNPKWAGCSAALASSQATRRSKIARSFRPLRKLNRTFDNVMIASAAGLGTRLVGSFVGVLRAGTSVPANMNQWRRCKAVAAKPAKTDQTAKAGANSRTPSACYPSNLCMT